MQKLPIGIQDFKILRAPEEGQGYVYIDKTELIYRLVTDSRYYFLSRPRRFGKTLLISTLDHLFRGVRQLFEGLWIEPHWNWATPYPVLKIDFNQVIKVQTPLPDALAQHIDKKAREHGITLTDTDPKGKFEELLEQLHNQYGKGVVVLIDEYDKSITDYLANRPQAEANREVLRQFYSALKGAESLLRFVFITGVSKFGKLSLFSDLNHLRDITLSRDYTTLLGYTETEIDQWFTPRLEAWAQGNGMKPAQLKTQLQQWYNGYSWNGQDFVFNPWSVLNAMQEQVFQSYWYDTGTPKLLISLLETQTVQLQDLEGYTATPSLLDQTQLEHTNVFALFWQTGYLTVKSRTLLDSGQYQYQLGFPNREVTESFLISYLDGYHVKQAGQWPNQLYQALARHDLDTFFSIVNALLAAIPYHQWVDSPKEAYFHALLFVALKLSGHLVHSEVATATGRIDAVVETADTIYIFELKLTTAKAALQQIKDKGYALPYQHTGKKVLAVGIAFNPNQHQVTEWQAVER